MAANENGGTKPAPKTSRSETGHSINVANFKKLIAYVQAFGASYQPGNDDIKLANLQSLREQLEIAMTVNTNGLADMHNVENARREAFKPLKALSTRIINALSGSGASELSINDARLLVEKIRGTRLSKPNASEMLTEEDNSISTSQQSYNQLMTHFTNLKAMVTKQNKYKPVEKGLTVADLENFNNQLALSNDQYISMKRQLKDARIQRTRLLYDEKNGVVARSKLVKSYVLSMFNGSHPDYLKIREIPFKTILPKKKTPKKK